MYVILDHWVRFYALEQRIGMNESAFINELKENLQKRDFIKIKVLINHLGHLDALEQNRFLLELSKIDSEFSIQVLAYLAGNDLGLGIPEAQLFDMLLEKVVEQPESLIKLFKNKEIANTGLLIELAVEIQPAGIVSALVNQYGETKDPDLRSELLKALIEIGTGEATRAMSALVSLSDEASWIPIVTSIGAMENADAVECLIHLIGQHEELDRTVLQTCYGMKLPSAHKVIVDSLHSPWAATRKRAKILILLTPRNFLPHLMNNLSSWDADFVIQALNMLGDIGDSIAVRPIKKLLRHLPADSNVRFAAYEALGFLAIDKGLFTIVNGLSDEEPSVRVAAARALNSNHNEVVLYGIRNMLDDSESNIPAICEAFLNAFADDMVASLYAHTTFRKQAENYLINQAHPDTRTYYHNLFDLLGEDEWKLELETKDETSEQEEQRVVVVDDSKMILSIFRQTFHKINVAAETYEFPVKALEAVLESKPSIVFTDLNMPEMTGIELTLKIREKYKSSELPIVMVTTQSEGADHEKAYEAGVNRVINKPFTADQLSEAMELVTEDT